MGKNWKALAAALALGAVACGGGSGSNSSSTTASCNVPAGYFCMDIDGILPTDKNDCTSNGGAWSGSACSTANVVGSCALKNPGAAQTITVRFYPPQTSQDAQNMCSSMCSSLVGGGAVVCNSTCTSLLTDPLNCGACGTACPSGHACSAGVCQ
jgi:hypothetical protein